MLQLQQLSAMSVTKKLGLLTLSAILGILLLTVIFMSSERSLVMQERQNAVRQNVEVAYGLLTEYHDLATKGTLTEEQAKQQALQRIRGLRYSGSEYFWINDMHPRMIMHPINPALEGKDLTDNKDPNGKHLFVEFVNVVKAQGSGFVFYLWPKPNNPQPVEKVSYVQGFAPWGWIIGSGVYIDTVNASMLTRLIEFSAGGLLLALLLLLIGWLISRSVTRELGGEPSYAVGVTRRIASGDLTVPIRLKRGDNSSLLHAIAAMRDSIAGIVAQVRSGTEAVASASGQIAAGNMDLSSRTEQQASSLGETASSLAELTTTVRHNADNARQANQLAMSASGVAQNGGQVVAQVVDTMGSINQSSKKIADIIGVIDGIAFQTNILALNAAVEAARAGEQGRGFAVVATEVRNLAQRSAAAAKEIKGLISDSVEKVDTGARLVGQAGQTMDEIVVSVKRVTDIIGEIASASAEQTSGVEQINVAISQMDQVTQQNAALVEQAAAAAASLQEQARELSNVVAVFQITDAPATSAKLAAPVRSKVLGQRPKSRMIASRRTSASKKLAAPADDGDWDEF
ncbi:MAG: methyl-accepting chemotaxis protein [Herbaspirillum sp.]